MKLYLRLLKNVRPYWKRLASAMVLMIILSASTTALASLVGPFVTYLVSSGKTMPTLIGPLKFLMTFPKESLFYYFPIVLFIISLVKGTSYFGQAYLMGSVGQSVINDLRNTLYQHIQYLQLNFFTKTSTGEFMSRITSDVYLVQGAVTTAPTIILRDGFTVIALLSLAFFLDWKMMALSACVFPGAVLIIVNVGKRLRRVTTRSQETYGRLSTLMHETFTGIRVVKAFGMEKYEGRKFQEETRNLLLNVLKGIRTYAVFVPLMEFITVLGLIAAFWYGGYRISHGDLKPENFVSFFTALVMLYQPVKNLSGVNNTVQEGLAAAQRIYAILDAPGEVMEAPGAVGIMPIAKSVEFRDVSFAYEKDWVLRDISFSVKRGENVALVGMSGAGKSTLMNLLLRFYDVTKGEILLDGVKLNNATISSLRNQIGIVTQQVILFNDTVRNNIAYGDIQKKEEEIISAAKAANAHNFISALPNGYDTMIGEGGVKLSGGERQRLAIARAILKDAPILIMDEATSSLDSESEEEVQKALEVLMKSRTTFVIAHRLSTVRNADRIIVLSKGRVVEIGKHEDLLKKRGEYFRLHAKQFKGPVLRLRKKHGDAGRKRALA